MGYVGAMDLTQITEAKWMCEPHSYRLDSDYDDAFHYAGDAFQNLIGGVVWELGGGYAINESLNAPEDAFATLNGVLVGYYCDEGLALANGHTRKRLGPALILAASSKRQPPTRRKVTAKGDAALRRAWRYANGLEKPPWPIPDWISHAAWRGSMKRKGWLRLWIVLTVVGVPVASAREYNRLWWTWFELDKWTIQQCVEWQSNAATHPDARKCEHDAGADQTPFQHEHVSPAKWWSETLAVFFVVDLFLTGLLIAAFLAGRWVVRGFRQR